MIFFMILFGIGMTIVVYSVEDKHFTKAIGGLTLIYAAFILGGAFIQEQKVIKICETEHISYTLVETAADHINCTKLEIAQFFSHVDEIMEPVEALMLLDENVSEEEALAILQQSDNKQTQ